jgi:DNA-binding NarL/FixJ family response regulator
VSEPLRVLLADDHPMFREGLRFTLGREPDLRVIGEAGTGAEAVRLAAELDPDVVVMDLAMPELGGLAATRQLTERGLRARVLVLTMSEDDESVFAAVRAGAGGYLVKGADPEQVVSAVRAIAQGHAVFGPHLAGRMLAFFTAPPPDRLAPPPGLSAREAEVLALLAEGMTNQEIGRALFISPITVRNHVSSIFAKLQVTNRQQAMLRARGGGQQSAPPQP